MTVPFHFAELKDLPELGREELALALMTKIVDKMTKDLDLRAYHDGFKERIEALITSKMKGVVVQVKEAKKPAAKSMMETTQAFSANLIAGSRTWIFAGLLLVFQLRPSWRKPGIHSSLSSTT